MHSHSKKAALAIAVASVFGTATTQVNAHGYVSAFDGGAVESRVALCKYATADGNQKNTGCGAIQYEPQSVEGPEGFPAAGPVDGQIASAQFSLAAALNEQTADRWVKRPISAGENTFEWTFTANHVTRDFRYYITQPDWNPNQVLARSSFDLTPFCIINGNMQKPPQQSHHTCNVPEREGYHVILAVWDVGDTAAAFYNVIDVEFEGQSAEIADWRSAGQINATVDLNIGDKVFTRVFDQNGENNAYSTELEIDSEALTQAANWSHALASKINQEQQQIKAGQYQQDSFAPSFGRNPIYLAKNSDLVRVEVGYDIQEPAPVYGLEIDGLEPSYIITDGPLELALDLTASGDISAELSVYNHARQALASWSGEILDGQNQHVVLTIAEQRPGHHMLISRIKDQEGNLIEQNTLDFHIKNQPVAGDYDFVFPDGLKEYTAGTKVLGSDGAIYQCKPFPYSGWCSQWTEAATHYTPATGSHWSDAWIKL